MSVRPVRVHGRKVWQARVAFQGLRSSHVCESRDAAKLAQAELLQELKRRAGQAEQAGLAPATMRQLFDAYAQDLEDRGKGEDTIARAVQTRAVLEALLPELLAKPLSRITEADILAFRRARAERPSFAGRWKARGIWVAAIGVVMCGRRAMALGVYLHGQGGYLTMKARSPTRRFNMTAGPATPPTIGLAMAGEIMGFLHIVRLDAPVDPVTAEDRIAFAPLGGRLRSRHVIVDGLDQLTAFLRQAHVPTSEIERAWRALAV